jgi:hypothetical protein
MEKLQDELQQQKQQLQDIIERSARDKANWERETKALRDE